MRLLPRLELGEQAENLDGHSVRVGMEPGSGEALQIKQRAGLHSTHDPIPGNGSRQARGLAVGLRDSSFLMNLQGANALARQSHKASRAALSRFFCKKGN